MVSSARRWTRSRHIRRPSSPVNMPAAAPSPAAIEDHMTIKDSVKEKYAEAALKVLGGGACGCDPVSDNLYDTAEKSGLPEGAVLASLGCGNPTALADLHEGEIANIPLPSAAVDVIISNCVSNLSADKSRVLKEAFRVLRPNGRFAVSDVVCRGEMPDAVRRSMELWVGCIAGALEENEYRQLLADAGFVDIEVEPTRIYAFEDARAVLAGSGLDADVLAREVSGRIMG